MAITPKKSVSVLSTSIEPVKPVAALSGLLYGGPNAGKTHLLSSAANFDKTSPALLITYDRRDATLAKFTDNPNLKVIDVCRASKDASLTVSMFTDALVKDLRRSKLEFRFIGIDGISRLLNPLVYRDIIMDEVSDTHRNYPHDPELMEQQDYKRATTRVYDWLEEFRNICLDRNISIILTAREREVYIDSMETGFKGDFYYPDLPPELHRLLTHEYDFIYRVTITPGLQRDPVTKKPMVDAGGKPLRGMRILHTEPSRSMVTKDRVGKLVAKVPNPTVELLWKCNVGREMPPMFEPVEDTGEDDGKGSHALPDSESSESTKEGVIQ